VASGRCLTRMRLIFVTLVAALAFAAAPARPSLLEDLRSHFDTSSDKVKARLACKGAWDKKPATTPAGKSYTIETCPDAKQQVMTLDGKVYAVGIALVDRTNTREADATMKGAVKELVANCKELRKPGQLGLYDCPSAFTVAVMNNWNSKDDTNTVSALFGDTATLHSMLGIK